MKKKPGGVVAENPGTMGVRIQIGPLSQVPLRLGQKTSMLFLISGYCFTSFWLIALKYTKIAVSFKKEKFVVNSLKKKQTRRVLM